MRAGAGKPVPQTQLPLINKKLVILKKRKIYFFGVGGSAFVNELAQLLLQKYSLMCVLFLCMLTSPITLSFPHFAHLSVNLSPL